MKMFDRNSSPTDFQKSLGIAIYFAGGKRALARHLDCSPNTLNNWLSGRTEPPWSKLNTLLNMQFDPETIKSFQVGRKSAILSDAAPN